MSLRNALHKIKREEAEKFSETFYRPPILFIPEDSHIEKWDKKEPVLLVNSNAIKKRRKEKHHQEKFPCAIIWFGRRLL